MLEIGADRTGALPGSFVSTAAVSTVIVGALGRLAAGSESILETLSENYFSNIELMMREEKEGEKSQDYLPLFGAKIHFVYTATATRSAKTLSSGVIGWKMGRGKWCKTS